MKKNIHPENYRSCVFKDISTDFAILTKSCAESNETIKWEDGNEYPLIKMEISSDSHPFYTGKTKLVDTAGRIDKFKTKYQSFKKYNK
tara:strand:- start:310 stop:573 length:264 start_codon:yes stop_codon:yes gene_type:complete